jgi:hypothetical protein
VRVLLPMLEPLGAQLRTTSRMLDGPVPEPRRGSNRIVHYPEIGPSARHGSADARAIIFAASRFPTRCDRGVCRDRKPKETLWWAGLENKFRTLRPSRSASSCVCAAGVAGLFIWPLWFAMDFQGAATKEVAALQSRQQYLGTMAEQKQCMATASARPHPPVSLAAPLPPSAATPPVARSAPPQPSAAIPAVSLAAPPPQSAAASLVAPRQPPSAAPDPVYTPADPPPSGPAVVGPAKAGQTVLLPVTINHPYYPHWTIQ